MSHRLPRLPSFESLPLYGSPQSASDLDVYGQHSFGVLGLFGRYLIPFLGIAALLFVVFGIALIFEALWYKRHPVTQVGISRPMISLVKRFLVYWIVTTLLIAGGIVALGFIFLSFARLY